MTAIVCPDALLGAADPPVFRILGARGRSPVVLTADHAGRAIPGSLARLQLSEDVLDTHVAWDLGVAALAERLSARLDVCAAVCLPAYPHR